MGEEKRLRPRIDFHHNVFINGARKSSKIMNISTGGAFIRVANPLWHKKGKKINMLTKLPLERKAMIIKAQVTHVGSRGIGVEFIDIWGREAAALENNFEIFKHTLPLPGT